MTSKRWWTTGIDYIDILYIPYTMMSVSYVLIGAMFAPKTDWFILAILMFGWFLGVGILAHALDELKGHPLGTKISDRTLKFFAFIAFVGTANIFILLGIYKNWLYIPIYIINLFIAVLYNLELFKGRGHNDVVFMTGFGFMPQIVGYYGMVETLPPISLLLVFVGLTACCGVETVVNHFIKFQSEDYHKAYDKRFAYLSRAVWAVVFLPIVVGWGMLLWKVGL